MQDYVHGHDFCIEIFAEIMRRKDAFDRRWETSRSIGGAKSKVVLVILIDAPQYADVGN